MPELVRLDIGTLREEEQELVTSRLLEYLRTERPGEICQHPMRSILKNFAENGIRSQIIDMVPTRPEMEFPRALEMKRHFILHVGPTNCGKTYQALQRLRTAYKLSLIHILKQFYAGTPFVPRELILQKEIDDIPVLEEWLTARRGARVYIRVKLFHKIQQNLRLIRILHMRHIKMLAPDQLAATHEKHLYHCVASVLVQRNDVLVLPVAVRDFLLLGHLLYAVEQIAVPGGFLEFQEMCIRDSWKCFFPFSDAQRS